MLNTHIKLNPEVLSNDVEKAYVRDGFGLGLIEAGEHEEDIVVLCADLAESTRTQWFKDRFPDRYIELGVAEQNLATVASGLANYGKIPFIASYASFSPGRNNEQIRTTISLNNVPVKIIGCHAGVSVGPDGATHQALEDIALMRVQPRMNVIVPCDKEEARKATIAIADIQKPFYLRLGREKTPVITTEYTDFEVGKAYALWESENPQITLVGCGPLLYGALQAAERLEEEGIGTIVINSHTIKPLDKETILDAIRQTRGLVSIEEHQIAGGLGGALAELCASEYPIPQEFVGMRDRFGESGNPEELIKSFEMDADGIYEATKRLLERIP
jgi:transketolase